MRPVLFALMALLLALPAATPASAHQQKITITNVSHNPRTDMVEVIHFVPLHDAEHALKSQGIAAPDIVGDIESRRAFVRYLAERFVLEASGTPVALTLLGSEVDGGNLVIYLEGPSPGLGTDLRLGSQLLTDIWARQENRVNIGSGGERKTLIFRAGDRPQAAELR
jgi:hypothetical protein